MKLTTPTTLLLALSLLAPSARAQDTAPEAAGEPVRRYAVEIIVFRYVEDVFSGSEVFPPDPPPPVDETLPVDSAFAATLAIDSAEIVPPDAVEIPEAADAENPTDDALAEREPSAGAVLLLRDELSMLDFARKLELLDVYEPMLHVGWTQPVHSQDDSVPLDVAFFGPPPPGLEGQFTLYLGRFLHLVVDLALDAEPTSEQMAETGAAPIAASQPLFSFGDDRPQYDGGELAGMQTQRVRYRIEEDRIMKSDDVRYFDHPKFGVIARVTRIETPPADDDLGPLPGVMR